MPLISMEHEKNPVRRIPILVWGEREFTLTVPWIRDHPVPDPTERRDRNLAGGERIVPISMYTTTRKTHMRKQLGKMAGTLLLALWFAPTGAHGDSMIFNPVADTFINSAALNNNGGGLSSFDAGRDGGNLGTPGIRHGLLRFDLSGLPSGSVVTSAVLTLKAVKIPGFGAVDSSFDLLRVNAAWAEGTNSASNNGGPASTGESSWNARIQGTANWTTPGAMADTTGTPSATVAVNSTVNAVYAWGGSGVLADVQFWLANSAQNFGWLLKSQDEVNDRTVRGFGSRESVDKPTLTIGYTPATSSNNPPMAGINNPTNGAAFTTPANVTIEATATDNDGTVTNVAFFDGATLLGNIASAPYSLTVGLFPGSHNLTVVATDNLGATTTSTAVTISVGSVVISNPIVPRIPKGDIAVELETIADGMASPLSMAVPDDSSGRMFVNDQDGRVHVIIGKTRLATPLLDLRSRLVLLGAYDERGLLGLAVHPNFAQNPLIYTYTSEPVNGTADFTTGVANDHQSVITEWRISAANSNLVDVASRREVMRIDEPQSNHNGGTMRFGPDGLLYVTLGDGGQANDVGTGHVAGGNAQDLNRILGKVIRIDVNGNNAANGKYGIPAGNPFIGTNALPEIYAYGLRNPFSFSFDRQTGQLYLADVGQNKVEEVDIITAGGNYGWNLREGAFWFDPSSGSVVTAPVRQPPTGMIDPIAQYDHDDGSAVIGGFVYRGTAIPQLAGRYVFGDWGSFSAPSGRLFYLDDTNGVTELRMGGDDRLLGLWLKGFGEGPDSELYAFGSRWLGPSGDAGRMVKLVPVGTALNLGGLTPANNTNVAASWSGGLGPFALQRKSELADASWTSVVITNQRAAVVAQNGAAGFFRVEEAGRLPTVPLTAYATGGGEHPVNGSTATAFGIFHLNGNSMTFNISYQGLSGNATAAHIHAPASTSGNSGVLIDFSPYNGGAWGSNGTVSGVIVLTDTQKAYVLAGLSYINFHTASFPGGEIRGQIAPVNLQVELSGSRENPVTSATGRGLGNLSLVGNQLTLNVTYAGLSGSATAAHIHGPAVPGQNAGVLVDLSPFNGGAFGSQGSLSGSVTLTPAQMSAMIDGQTYINFHTALFPGGEIRGQIVPHPTGVPATVLLSGLAEKPTALTNSATGDGTLSLEGNRLTFNLRYSGLSSAATAAHIHGPASSTVNAGVMIDLAPFNGGAFGTAGTISGSVNLTVAQRNALLGGSTYINFHTAANPGGEMRGQIAPVAMSSTLSGNNERPTPLATTGTGSGTFALVRDRLAVAVTYRNLSSTATASHIHGPASLTGTAGVLVPLDPYNGGAYGISGSLSGIAPMTVPQLLNLIDGLTYVNVHTSLNGGGEIRGHIFR